jgi:hypothetical protein
MPTLCHTVIAFEAFRSSLEALKLEELRAEFIIGAGLKNWKSTMNMLYRSQHMYFQLVSSHFMMLNNCLCK